jgi:hypothetical protein
MYWIHVLCLTLHANIVGVNSLLTKSQVKKCQTAEGLVPDLQDCIMRVLRFVGVSRWTGLVSSEKAVSAHVEKSPHKGALCQRGLPAEVRPSMGALEKPRGDRRMM